MTSLSINIYQYTDLYFEFIIWTSWHPCQEIYINYLPTSILSSGAVSYAQFLWEDEDSPAVGRWGGGHSRLACPVWCSTVTPQWAVLSKVLACPPTHYSFYVLNLLVSNILDSLSLGKLQRISCHLNKNFEYKFNWAIRNHLTMNDSPQNYRYYMFLQI